MTDIIDIEWVDTVSVSINVLLCMSDNWENKNLKNIEMRSVIKKWETEMEKISKKKEGS